MKIKTVVRFSIKDLNQIALRIAFRKVPQFKGKKISAQFTDFGKDGFVGIEVQECEEDKELK